jgi:hypothetical protein
MKPRKKNNTATHDLPRNKVFELLEVAEYIEAVSFFVDFDL